jgi:hypothetical protein
LEAERIFGASPKCSSNERARTGPTPSIMFNAMNASRESIRFDSDWRAMRQGLFLESLHFTLSPGKKFVNISGSCLSYFWPDKKNAAKNQNVDRAARRRFIQRRGVRDLVHRVA